MRKITSTSLNRHFTTFIQFRAKSIERIEINGKNITLIYQIESDDHELLPTSLLFGIVNHFNRYKRTDSVDLLIIPFSIVFATT